VQVRGWVERLTGQVVDEAGVVRFASASEWAERFRRYPRPAPDRLPPRPFERTVSAPAGPPPLPVQVAGTGGYRRGAEQEIERWLNQLGTPTQDQALQVLAEFGPAMLPVADRFQTTAGPEARAALATLRATVARDAAAQPRRVTLKLDKAPLADAVAALARECGLPLALGASAPGTIDLDLRDMPAWQAVDELRRRARLSLVPSAATLLLKPGSGTPPELVAYPGPFRLQVMHVFHSKSRYLGDQPLTGPPANASLSVQLALNTTPSARVTAFGHPRVKSARTDTGEVLATPGLPPLQLNPVQPTPAVVQTAVVVKPPPARRSRFPSSGCCPSRSSGCRGVRWSSPTRSGTGSSRSAGARTCRSGRHDSPPARRPR
jgi:hypothetical protein